MDFVLDNNIYEVERMHAVIDQLASEGKLGEGAAFAIKLALEEVLLNIINYGYDDKGPHQILVRIDGIGDELISVEIEDDGRAFNPLERAAPDLTASIEDRQIGGLGIHLVKKMMDDVQYRRVDGKNVLSIKKKAQE